MSSQGSSAVPIRVVVHGALGRMGRETLAALCKTPDMTPVGAVDLQPSEKEVALPDGSLRIPLSGSLAAIIEQTKPQVVVDFSRADAAIAAARVALPARVAVVVGASGLGEVALKEIEALCNQYGVGAVVAPNFALGAVLLTHIARTIARFFDYAEVVEAHHEAKIDAPSGTALSIARALAEGKGGRFKGPVPEKETLPGTRGGDYQGVGIHAIRMPGRLAHHEVILGTTGQVLALRHDSIGRDSFMPGVLLAIRQVVKSRQLVVGLEKLLGLG